MTNDAEDVPFDHVVITRFSAVFDPAHDPMPREWVEYRLGFFYDSLCASMRAQEGAAPFTWIVFFDDRTDADLRAEIDECSVGLFVPIWTSRRFSSEVPVAVQARRTGKPYLLTTRIDSDDGIGRDYLASIQAEFDGTAGITYNFGEGLQVVRTGEVYRYNEPAGPFQTYVEKLAPDELPRTVFGEPRHHMARAKGMLREVQSEPMWLQVIHGGNIANSVRGVRTSPRVLEERFVLDLPYRHDVSRRELAVGAVTSRVARVRYWRSRPYYLLETVDATVGRVLGTRTLAQKANSEGPPVTSAVQHAARRVVRWRRQHAFSRPRRG